MDIFQIRKKVGAKEVLYRSGLKQTAGSPFFGRAGLARDTLNVGLSSSVFTRWWTPCMERKYTRQVLKTRFSITLFVMVTPIYKGIRNLFEIYRMIRCSDIN